MSDLFNTLLRFACVVELEVKCLKRNYEDVKVRQWSNIFIGIDIPGFGGIGEIASGIASLFSLFDFRKLDVFSDAKNSCSDGSNRDVLPVKVEGLCRF